jgi:hypothetical protein
MMSPGNPVKGRERYPVTMVPENPLRSEAHGQMFPEYPVMIRESFPVRWFRSTRHLAGERGSGPFPVANCYKEKKQTGTADTAHP